MTQGGDKDLRTYRSVWRRRKGSGVTFCGAPVDSETRGHDAGFAALRLPHWKAQLCPACVAKMEAQATYAERGK